MNALWSVNGWRCYYDLAVKERWFEGKEATPFDSVFYSNFEDLVFKISIARGY